MATKKIDIKAATLEELKATAYDLISAIEQNQASLKLINDEVGLRIKAEQDKSNGNPKAKESV